MRKFLVLTILISATLLVLNACTQEWVSLPETLKIPEGAQASAHMIFTAEFDLVWQAVLTTLIERNEPIGEANKAQRRITTSQVTVEQQRLKEIADLPTPNNFTHGGWYTLTLTVTRISARQTRVTVNPFIVAAVPEVANILGGVPVDSKGTLESEIFKTLTEKLRIEHGVNFGVIQGQVLVSPACPGPTRPGCDTKPLQARLQLETNGGKIFLKLIRTTRLGRFSVKVVPGTYRIHALPFKNAILPRPPDDEIVTVQRGQTATIQVIYDSGLR
ncbi:hypothetical protein HYR54_03980 [Candidatus Acetothermia bacterium]|nr:hypothetical protein [Candidatus Acetothermia bacterium]